MLCHVPGTSGKILEKEFSLIEQSLESWKSGQRDNDRRQSVETFQIHTAMTRKAWSPTAESRDVGTASVRRP